MSTSKSEIFAILAIAVTVLVTLFYGPDVEKERVTIKDLSRQIDRLDSIIAQLKNDLSAQNALDKYERLLARIDAAPDHAVLLEEHGPGKVKIWAVASHETPEYFTSAFGAFNKRYMSSSCAVYAQVRNEGAYSNKWCP